MSMALLAVPGVGLLISALAFHEAVNLSLGLGVVLIAAGVLLTTTGAAPLPRGDEGRLHDSLRDRTGIGEAV
jgi:drug/metabolite transporter (DMT)-like permease